jgi:hypothetical protein
LHDGDAQLTQTVVKVARKNPISWRSLQVRAFYLGLLLTVTALLFVLGTSWITSNSSKSTEAARGLSADEVLAALGIGFGLWHLFRFIQRGPVSDPSPHFADDRFL